MTTLFISSLILILLAAGGAVWMIHKSYSLTVEGLRADNKDLRDRLFQKNNIPPSGVDLTEKYEERQERERERRNDPNPQKKALGPIEQLTDRWTKDDRDKVERKNVDATQPRNFVN